MKWLDPSFYKTSFEHRVYDHLLTLLLSIVGWEKASMTSCGTNPQSDPKFRDELSTLKILRAFGSVRSIVCSIEYIIRNPAQVGPCPSGSQVSSDLCPSIKETHGAALLVS